MKRYETTPTNFSIVRTHPDILKYVVHLQKKNSDELGFLPRTAFERAVEAGQLFLGLLNGEPCGYIFAGSGYKGVLRRWQACIQYDARRRFYGGLLVSAVEKYGETLGCTQSEVRCASDLEANLFWVSMGYKLTGIEKAGESRKYRRSHINLWGKDLSPSVPATQWRTGRPRVYASNAEKQKAYRLRKYTGGI
jgi:hypothetical protein